MLPAALMHLFPPQDLTTLNTFTANDTARDHPTSNIPLTNNEALSGIFGTISICCWIFVSAPQLYENYRNSSATGISIIFLGIWLFGDLTNFLGAIWAQLLPTVQALAIWYLISDGALIGQVVWYEYWPNSWRNPELHSKFSGALSKFTGGDHNNLTTNNNSARKSEPDEEEPLLGRQESGTASPSDQRRPRRRPSSSSDGSGTAATQSSATLAATLRTPPRKANGAGSIRSTTEETEYDGDAGFGIFGSGRKTAKKSPSPTRTSDWDGLEPATEREEEREEQAIAEEPSLLAPPSQQAPPTSNVLFNTAAICSIFALGIVAWVIMYKIGVWKPQPAPGSSSPSPSHPDDRGNNDPFKGHHNSTGPGEVPGHDDTLAPHQAPIGSLVLGYMSAIAYLGARIPQIIKNYRSRSTEGLSPLFFMLSLCANLTYGLGILCHSLEKNYVKTNIPWLLGSLGTIFEDVTIFVQFRLYNSSNKDGLSGGLKDDVEGISGAGFGSSSSRT